MYLLCDSRLSRKGKTVETVSRSVVARGSGGGREGWIGGWMEGWIDGWLVGGWRGKRMGGLMSGRV